MESEVKIRRNSQNMTKNQMVDISFENISYVVQLRNLTKKQRASIFPNPCAQKIDKSILSNVSGVCKAGEITAIMGASGSGKTSLLNILAGRIAKSQYEGKTLANNVEYDFNKFTKFGNYVLQKDLLYESLNVRETLYFAGYISSTQHEQVIEQKIDVLIRKLKLEKCLDTFVGGNSIASKFIKGISGGQRKRLSIAFEILSNPKVLILDQPTSGLDAFTAYLTVKLLKKMALKQGVNIILTIHQPNSKIFALIDRLILLTRGNIVYQGAAKNSLQHFQKIAYAAPKYSNPPDYLLSLTHPFSAFAQQNLEKMKSAYLQMYDSSSKQNRLIERSAEIIQKQRNKPGFCMRLGIMVKRQLINAKRNPLVIFMRLLSALIVPVYIGGMYFQYEKDLSTEGAARTALGFLYIVSAEYFIHEFGPLILDFPVEKDVYTKQTNANVYKPLEYYLSKFVVQTPIIIVASIIFSIIIYFMAGLTGSAKQFFTFWFVVFLVGEIGGAIGMLTGALLGDPKLAGAAAPIVVLPQILFSGYFKNRQDLRDYFRWIQYIMPLKYGFNAHARNQLEAETPTLAELAALDQINFEFQTWTAIYILIALFFGFKILGYIFLILLKRKVI